MGRSLNPVNPLKSWRRNGTTAAKLYGAIVAQARLAVCYQGFGVPDTLEGRFLILSLHLFGVLHRIEAEGPAARGLARDLTSRFGADMETVLREIGVGDLSMPKKMRSLAASSAALLQTYEEALGSGEEVLAGAIVDALPSKQSGSEAVARRLAHYLRAALDLLRRQNFAQSGAGDVIFPVVTAGEPKGNLT